MAIDVQAAPPTDLARQPSVAASPPPFHRRLLAPPRLGHLVAAFVLWVLSLAPTLLPRAWVTQVVISAICAAVGWMLGAALQGLAEWSLGISGRSHPESLRATAWLAFGIVACLTAVPALWMWVATQNAQRALLGMDAMPMPAVVPLVLATALLTGLLVLAGRTVSQGVRWVDRQAARVIRPGWARALTAVLVVVAAVALVNYGQRRFVNWADEQFGALNETTEDGVYQPLDPTVSGSPASAVPWETLGLQGRSFVAGATPVGDLTRFHGAAAVVEPPIRVYVGLDSAPSEAERTALVLAELERTGAFDREVLVVATATGTGWINPAAAQALEYLHRGDTAIVTEQYSFLPSWITFLIDPNRSSDTGAALFAAVHERWSQLPEDARPLLLAYGESLGALGAEAAFAGDDLAGSLDAITTRTDGALMVGPTAGNPVLVQMLAEREPDAPTWQPVGSHHPHLRLENDIGGIDAADGAWAAPRILYLLHPTDAVATWTPRTIWERPGWAGEPHGHGVIDQVGWFPLVTWIQETGDLISGFTAQAGYGHDYSDAFVPGWAAIAPPPGWTPADTAKLTAHLESLDP